LFEMNEEALESILCSLRDDAEALLQLVREQRRVI